MLQLPEVLTQTTATVFLRELAAKVSAEPAVVVVDAARLGQFDSVALAVLLELRRQALKIGKTFAVVGLPERLGNLARLYGIAELLPTQA